MISMKHSNKKLDGTSQTDRILMDRRSTKRYAVNDQVCCVINRYHDIVCQVVNVSINGITLKYPIPEAPFDLKRFTIDLYSSDSGYYAKNVLCETTFDKYEPCIKMFYCVPLRTVGIRFVNLTVSQLKRIENFKRQTTIGLTRDRRSGFDRRFSEDRRNHIRPGSIRPDRRCHNDRRIEGERRRQTFGVNLSYSPN